jgi:hypothetical protein
MNEAQRIASAKDVIVQLGISALVVLVLGYVGYKIAMLLINKWAENDSRRTVAIQEGFKSITATHATVMQTVAENHHHVLSVINAHQADELEVINEFRVELTRLDQKVSTALELTPPPMKVPILPNPPPETSTPVDRPPVKHPRAKTGPISNPTDYVFQRDPRPKKA